VIGVIGSKFEEKPPGGRHSDHEIVENPVDSIQRCFKITIARRTVRGM